MDDTEERSTESRLLIVDDHGLVREGLLALFHPVEDILARAIEAGRAVWATRHFAPEVVLINRTLTDACAFETAESVLLERPSSRVMFLDDAMRPARLRMALAAGVHGYWTNRASFDQLCDAVRQLRAGRPSLCPTAQQYVVLSDGVMRFDQAADGTALAGLTHRECQVLALLAEGLCVKKVAGRLDVSPRTVDSHRSNLMRKLGVHKIVDLVRLAMSEGLIE